MVGRNLALATAVLIGLVLSQAPEFAQQYRQRLAGAIGELATVINRFDQDAARSGFTRQTALAHMAADEDRLVRDQSAAMETHIERYRRLTAQRLSFEHDGSVARLLTLLGNFDAGLVKGTFDDYEPAVPTTMESLLVAGAGFLLAYALFRGIGHQIRRRRRLRREGLLIPEEH
jgi:hypothetical protein